MPSRIELEPTALLVVGGENVDAAAELFRRLAKNPDSTTAEIRMAWPKLGVRGMSWVGGILGESSAHVAHRLVLDFWAQTLERLARSSPDLPPWQLASWKLDREEQIFFGSVGDIVSSDWSAADISSTALDALSDSSAALRAAGADLCGTWHGRQKGRYPPDLERALVAALRDQRDSVRERSAWALSLAPPPDAGECLLRLATDGAGRIRAPAIAALGKLENGDARIAVMSALRDPHPWVRVAALHSLEVSAPDVARLEAQRMVRDSDPWVAEMAVAVISRVNRQGYSGTL
jgi:hypothetical protein